MADAPQTMADLLGKNVPSLSSTSDMPVADAPTKTGPLLSATAGAKQPEYPDAVDATPAPTKAPDVAATAEPAATKPPAATKAPDATEPPATEPGETKKPQEGIAKRMSELTSARNAAVELADGAVAKLNETTAKLNEALAKLGEVKPPEAPDPRPAREGFDTPEAFETALIDWAGRKEAKNVETAVEAKLAEARATEKAEKDAKTADESQKAQEAETARLSTEWQGRVEKAKTKYADFDEVAMSDAVVISIPMSHAILNAPDGADIAYYLGQNPEEAQRIAGLNGPMSVFEMGKISAKLAEAAKPKVTDTPPPPKPIGSRGGTDAATPLADLSMDDYAARRTAQLKEGRGARH